MDTLKGLLHPLWMPPEGPMEGLSYPWAWMCSIIRSVPMAVCWWLVAVCKEISGAAWPTVGASPLLSPSNRGLFIWQHGAPQRRLYLGGRRQESELIFTPREQRRVKHWPVVYRVWAEILQTEQEAVHTEPNWQNKTVELLMSESCCTCEGSTVFTVWISSSFYTKPLTFIYSMQQQSYLYDSSIFTNKDTSRCDSGILLLNLCVTL